MLESLPIDSVLPEITDALTSGSAAVLQAPTGAGKTTRVPPALIQAGVGDSGQVVVLEPRRLAARAAARRIAQEQGWRLGAEVGYHVRFDRRAGANTRILVVTEGILVQMLQRDPFLEAIGVVVFDEFHERNLQSDLALAMVRQVQLQAREDLRVIVMSATLEPRPIAQFFGGCPIIKSTGRLHPVAIHYLERADPRPLEAAVAAGVRRALDESEGDVLAFLPGVAEIRRCTDRLASLAQQQGIRVLQLYGDLPAEQQDAVLRPGARRKVVLATNVAETSVTIEGITAVVDSGQARILRFDPSHGLDRLQLERISSASAEQRAGRAGRQGPGLCLRLWTRHDNLSLAQRTAPEIRRVDLAAPALQLIAWGETDLERFAWFEPPDPSTLARAIQLLTDLGAINAGGSTDLGRTMARLPIHPRLARLLIAGRRSGEGPRAALCAALLSERDLVHRTGEGPATARTKGPSDLLDRLEALEQFDATGYAETALGPIHRGRARHVLRVSQQLTRLAKKIPQVTEGREPTTTEAPDDQDAILLRALLAAYPDRLARRRPTDPQRGLMVGGRGVRLSPASVVRDADLFLCLDLDSKGREAWVRQASRIDAVWLPEHQVRTAVETLFDDETERVVALRRTRYRDLVIAEVACDPRDADPEALEQALIAAASESLERALSLEAPEVVSFLARVRSLGQWMPELGLPTFEVTDLQALIPQLTPGKRSFAELRRAPLYEILVGSLGFETLRDLDRLAPERLEVPSGSRIRLRYEPGQPPILAVRIQEMFGLQETPSVAGGRVPVMLHLLAPSQRPQQVTQDLSSFWRRTYPQVRKELRARYPRHAWPEDPLSAKPERRPRRRR
ncbi:MAG: ATP-dependent helicase HrpB [Acidobacteriota bacterium]